MFYNRTLKTVCLLLVCVLSQVFAAWTEEDKAYSVNDVLHLYNDCYAIYLKNTCKTTTDIDSVWWSEFLPLFITDATDSQVALTGFNRDTLKAHCPSTYIGNFLNANVKVGRSKTRLDSLAIVVQAREAAATSITSRALSVNEMYPDNTGRAASLGMNYGMDYGTSANYITLACSPDNFADRRIIAGQPIKWWVMKYWIGAQGQRPKQAAFSPDFFNFHHNSIISEYTQSTWEHPGSLKIIPYVNQGFPLPWTLATPYSNLGNVLVWLMRQIDGNGYVIDPAGQNYMPDFVYTAVVLAALHPDDPMAPTALAVTARILESAKRLFDSPNFGSVANTQWINITGSGACENSYLFLRLLGGPKTKMTWSEAVKKLHGVYWTPAGRYMVHRTPDKYVSVAWNGNFDYMVNQAIVDAKKEFRYFSEADKLRYSGCPSYMQVTAVIPDNDANRPDSETLHSRPLYGMLGEFNGPTLQHLIKYRVNRTDAVLSTAGSIIRPQDNSYPVVERAVQYQSFTSLYDKTSISLVCVLEGKDGRGSETKWKNTFASSFFATSEGTYGKKWVAFENDSLEMSQYATRPYPTYPDTQRYTKLGSSSWYCVNDRVGVVTLGSSGSLKVLHERPDDGLPMTGNVEKHMTHGVTVCYDIPLEVGSKMVNMAAIYYTDTPRDKIRQLKDSAIILDSQLPTGWKGVVTSTPDGQRAMATARFFGDTAIAEVKLCFPEGAPIFEGGMTEIIGDTGKVKLHYDTLESHGQTMAFYLKEISGNITARQVGDLQIQLEGSGEALVKYLSRAEFNSVYINDVKSATTKNELAAGISVLVNNSPVTIRIENSTDSDYIAPAVNLTYPIWLADEQTEIYPRSTELIVEPDTVFVPQEGLKVTVDASDRSGVAWVDIYFDWQKVGRAVSEGDHYALTIPASSFAPISGDTLPNPDIHALSAVACDNLGNQGESFKVTRRFKVLENNTSVEKPNSNNKTITTIFSGKKVVAGSKEEVEALKGKENSQVTTVRFSEQQLVRTRVMPSLKNGRNIGGVDFMFQDIAYNLELNATANKVSLFRKGNKSNMLLAETAMKISSGKWYDLKIQASNGHLVGYVNGEAKIKVGN